MSNKSKSPRTTPETFSDKKLPSNDSPPTLVLDQPSSDPNRLPTPSSRRLIQDSHYSDDRRRLFLEQVERILSKTTPMDLAMVGGEAIANLGIVDVTNWLRPLTLQSFGNHIKVMMSNKEMTGLNEEYLNLCLRLWEQTGLGLDPKMNLGLMAQFAARDFFRTRTLF